MTRHWPAAAVVALLLFAAVAVWWQLRQIRHSEEARQGTVADVFNATPYDTYPPAAWDNEEGVRLDWADECARILTATNDQTAAFDAGCDRLLTAVRDEQQKGDQP